MNTPSKPVLINYSIKPDPTVTFGPIVMNVYSGNSVIRTNPTPKSGEIVTISALVRNTGSADASNIPIEIFAISPDQQIMQIVTTQIIPTLPVGGSSTIEASFDTTGKMGSYSIILKVDPDNTIAELTKDDNQASVQLAIIPLPDLAISNGNITFSKNPANIGDDVTVTATISNQGNAPAQNMGVFAQKNKKV